MSDDNARTGDGIHINHWCSHPGCKEWGGFGFAATKSEAPRWWCWEHYPYKAASRGE